MSPKKIPGQPVKAGGLLLMLSTANVTEFLLLRHATRWDLPKGHCEVGEDFLDAALRETEEETGIDRDSISLAPDFCFDLSYPVTYKKTGDQVFDKQVRYFLGRLKSKPILKLTEHESAKWFIWNPPHNIQEQTINPLLAAVESYLR